MIVLIDAYNIIKGVLGLREVPEPQIVMFTNKINQYSRKTGNKVILVFDGGFYNYIKVNRDKNFEVVYAGFGRSADDLIKNYLNELNPDNSILVTSDQELVRYGKHREFESMGSVEFYKNYIADKIESVQSHRTSSDFYKIHESGSDIDDLMMLYVTKVSLKRDDVNFSDLSHGEKVSKKDKKRAKILKKL